MTSKETKTNKEHPTSNAPDEADVLAEQIQQLPPEGILQELAVDNRVFARITDGIYRRPSSALRELIFNAYDADATCVRISTDCPRFTRMEISDNGNGMTEKQLSNLLTHIGGSSKRTVRGMEIGTASEDDPDLSPGKRRLIGKIGIGLFAVAHLTTHFEIITKAKGQDDWLVADIWLKTYTEEQLRNVEEAAGKPKFVTGEAKITKKKAESTDAHGTTITLFDIRQGTQDVLRRKELWAAIYERTQDPEHAQSQKGDQLVPPTYHIGYTDADQISYLVPPSLPWGDDDSAETRFQKLYECVSQGSKATTKNPDIDEFLDEYFSMIWRLSLAAPLRYLGTHPFEIKTGSGIDLYTIENKTKGRAQPISTSSKTDAATALNLTVPTDPVGGFDVFIDGIRLFRPTQLPTSLAQSKKSQAICNPLLFIGSIKSSLGTIDSSRSGGALEFDAYFYWNSVIVPKQNRGTLIRINNASGVLYDETFLDYRVSELNRLAQITGEIFVRKGLDAALNIDRESFNVSHPHYQYLTKWVHSALRQITNLLKDAGKKRRDLEKSNSWSQAREDLSQKIHEVWERRGDPLEDPPDIEIFPKGAQNADAQQLRITGQQAFSIRPDLLANAKSFTQTNSGLTPVDKTKAVFAILAAYGTLERLDYAEQEAMFEDILNILTTEAKK